ncbi:hypothetical protein, partial [Pseudoalteromonas sp. S1649]|uniref:hypothetical protein n=1 Tax=Pseudoalteromonas sp. S1649 TaxID=579508 RepID=UPI001BB13D76
LFTSDINISKSGGISSDSSLLILFSIDITSIPRVGVSTQITSQKRIQKAINHPTITPDNAIQ